MVEDSPDVQDDYDLIKMSREDRWKLLRDIRMTKRQLELLKVVSSRLLQVLLTMMVSSFGIHGMTSPSFSSPPPYLFPSSSSSYKPLFSSSSSFPSTPSSSPSSSSSSSPSFSHSFSPSQYMLTSSINTKASRSSCMDGLPSFELVTGYSYGGRSSDVLKTLTDMMNIQDCLTQCLRTKECKSVNFETGLCILLSSSANYTSSSSSTSSPSSSSPSSLSSPPSYAQGLKVSQYPVFTIYAEKVCIEGSRAKASCSGRAWTFERVIGFKLKDSLIRRTTTTLTRIHCMESCLNETSFECRSVTFNRESGMCNLFDLDRQGISSGQVLKRGLYANRKKRLFASTSADGKGDSNDWNFDQNFIPSDPDPVDYFESNCVKDPKQCEFAPIKNLILKTVDSVYENVRTIDSCKQRCLSSPYRCFSFDFGADPDPKNGGICRTSHINTGSVLTIENPFAEMPGAVTYQLVSCMNISVECMSHSMVAKIRTNRVFNGKIYSRSKPNSCMSDVRNSMDFSISLPYNDVMCDVLQEPTNGNIFRSELVVQHHDRIVTQSDFGVSVLCRFDLKNRTITNGPLHIDGSTAYSAEGTSGLIEASNIQWPNVSMRISDSEGKPVTSARVGDTLNLYFDINDLNSPYEIFVRDLVAVDGMDSSEIVLIDSYGCPTEMAIMTSVNKYSKTSKRLRTTFEAFKFPSSDTVQFRALITPCLSSCKPVQCNLLNTETGINQEFISYGRRRRRRMTRQGSDIPDAQAKPEVVVVGAIRIRDTFDFKNENQDEEADEQDVKDAFSQECTIDILGLGVAGLVFMFGQLTLLVAWYYMYQKVQEYRDKMLSEPDPHVKVTLPTTYASSSSSSSSSSSPSSGSSPSSFPSKYLFPRIQTSSSSSSSSPSGQEGKDFTTRHNFHY